MTAQLVDVSIDRTSPVPLYHQLSEQLWPRSPTGGSSRAIRSRTKSPSAQRLSLSRPTVRRAIQEMVDKGLLVRRRGLGTTVANRKVHRRVALSSLLRRPAREGRDRGRPAGARHRPRRGRRRSPRPPGRHPPARDRPAAAGRGRATRGHAQLAAAGIRGHLAGRARDDRPVCRVARPRRPRRRGAPDRSPRGCRPLPSAGTCGSGVSNRC